MYYMWKLCVYNQAFHSVSDIKAKCYLWSELNGKRGSNEISTCLQLYLSTLPSSVNLVILYSDDCPCQNRNQIVATCLLDAANTIQTIHTIDYKFLESGHTHMESDSAIEFAKSKTDLCTKRVGNHSSNDKTKNTYETIKESKQKLRRQKVAKKQMELNEVDEVSSV
ncbi:hypothetical protein MAR_007924 [Mya arenaria]|uniref:Uncharacterized protein n=1 Tax=Mya arenaria TaxID=6604 RepID=A0ABY7DYK1_MYAAR|nr:hypothetical protein MAR_007924 [Mya arenaria]